MPDAPLFISVLLTFLLAGTIKGVIGLGLPTVSLTLLTLLADLPTAMVLMLLPSLVTNLWQAFAGSHAREAIQRLWPLLLSAGGTVFVGGLFFSQLRLDLLSALLGLLILFYALASLAGWQLPLDHTNEKREGWVVGTINGVLTGLTGSSVVPGVMYLQALDMPRQMFIQSMGLLFSVSTLALAISLWLNNLLHESLTYLSFWAVFPAVLGMPIGQWLSRRIPDKLFRRAFFISLAVMGTFVLLRSSLQLL